MWRRRCFHGINAMILMPQIFDVTANENARYKRNELEFCVRNSFFSDFVVTGGIVFHKHIFFDLKLYYVAGRQDPRE